MTLKELFTNIANAIRSATGTTEKIKASNFAAKINAIKYRGVAVQGTDSGQNAHGVYYHIPSGYYNEDGTNSWVYRPLSDFGNAAASDVLSGKTFTSSSGKEVKGTMIKPTFKYKNGGLGQWDSAVMDFGAPCSAGYAQVTFHVDGYNNASRQDHYIEVSNNNSSWTTIAHLGSNPRDKDGAGRIYGSVSGYRFVRIRCECNNVNFRVQGYMIAGIV